MAVAPLLGLLRERTVDRGEALEESAAGPSAATAARSSFVRHRWTVLGLTPSSWARASRVPGARSSFGLLNQARSRFWSAVSSRFLRMPSDMHASPSKVDWGYRAAGPSNGLRGHGRGAAPAVGSTRRRRGPGVRVRLRPPPGEKLGPHGGPTYQEAGTELLPIEPYYPPRLLRNLLF